MAQSPAPNPQSSTRLGEVTGGNMSLLSKTRQSTECINSRRATSSSSTGEKQTPFVSAYFWNNRPWYSTVSVKDSSRGTVPSSASISLGFVRVGTRIPRVLFGELNCHPVVRHSRGYCEWRRKPVCGSVTKRNAVHLPGPPPSRGKRAAGGSAKFSSESQTWPSRLLPQRWPKACSPMVYPLRFEHDERPRCLAFMIVLYFMTCKPVYTSIGRGIMAVLPNAKFRSSYWGPGSGKKKCGQSCSLLYQQHGSAGPDFRRQRPTAAGKMMRCRNGFRGLLASPRDGTPRRVTTSTARPP